MPAPLVDSHCHLDFPDFAEDIGGIIARAQAAGVGTMVTISTRVRRFEALKAIIEAHDPVYASIGTHPHYAHEELDISADELIRLAEHPKVVAIGEVGLDYFYQHSSREAQTQGLRAHIAASRATQLPLVIHARDADDDAARILEEEMGKGAFPALLHCFTGSRELALKAVDLGLYVSFSGILTFKNSSQLRDIAAELPIDRLLVETDAPYLAPGKYRGRRNEPSFVVETAKVLAEAHGIGFEAMAKQTTANFHRLFAKVPARQAQAA